MSTSDHKAKSKPTIKLWIQRMPRAKVLAVCRSEMELSRYGKKTDVEGNVLELQMEWGQRVAIGPELKVNDPQSILKLSATTTLEQALNSMAKRGLLAVDQLIPLTGSTHRFRGMVFLNEISITGITVDGKEGRIGPVRE
jgi:hypothetical protein